MAHSVVHSGVWCGSVAGAFGYRFPARRYWTLERTLEQPSTPWSAKQPTKAQYQSCQTGRHSDLLLTTGCYFPAVPTLATEMSRSMLLGGYAMHVARPGPNRGLFGRLFGQVGRCLPRSRRSLV